MQEIDLSKIDELLNDPAHQDVFKLAERFGKMVCQHFRGREVDPYVVIEAAMTAVQAVLRLVPEDERDAVVKEDIIDRMEVFLDFLDGIGRPVEGEA
jgi:hypothetical protein